jgi:hypothetical protein
MIRFDDGQGTIVGGWSGGTTPAVPIGFRVSMEQDSTAARVHRTGRPARVDIDDLPGEAFAVLRELGVSATSTTAPNSAWWGFP